MAREASRCLCSPLHPARVLSLSLRFAAFCPSQDSDLVLRHMQSHHRRVAEAQGNDAWCSYWRERGCHKRSSIELDNGCNT